MVKSLRQEEVEASLQPPGTHQCTWRDTASSRRRCHITAPGGAGGLGAITRPLQHGSTEAWRTPSTLSSL